MQQQLGADNAAPGWLAWTVGIRDALPTLLALAISVCFAVILLGTIGFPLVTHADEPSKALAVLKHRNNFNHPLLSYIWCAAPMRSRASRRRRT